LVPNPISSYTQVTGIVSGKVSRRSNSVASCNNSGGKGGLGNDSGRSETYDNEEKQAKEFHGI